MTTARESDHIQTGEDRSTARAAAARHQLINVGGPERVLSALAGGALLLFGVTRAPFSLALAAVGGALAYRGLTGHCHAYQWLGVERGVRGNVGIKIERAITVQEAPAVLFRFWRDFRNLPHVMPNLESVSTVGDLRSHWVMKAPPGMAIEWDAEIINERPNELIAWRSTPASSIQQAGAVRFVPVGAATRVEVSLQYAPPAGELGHVVAELLGADAGTQVEEGLQNFKMSMEHARTAERANW